MLPSWGAGGHDQWPFNTVLFLASSGPPSAPTRDLHLQKPLNRLEQDINRLNPRLTYTLKPKYHLPFYFSTLIYNQSQVVQPKGV